MEKTETRQPNKGESPRFIMEAYKRARLSISKITKCTTFIFLIHNMEYYIQIKTT